MADVNPKVLERAGAEESGQPPLQAEVLLNDREAHVAYSNFARVTATPEEVIVDFALNPNPLPGRGQPHWPTPPPTRPPEPHQREHRRTR